MIKRVGSIKEGLWPVSKERRFSSSFVAPTEPRRIVRDEGLVEWALSKAQ